jgi:hypothetical protein
MAAVRIAAHDESKIEILFSAHAAIGSARAAVRISRLRTEESDQFDQS